MKEDFVPYDIAVKLKEKGFDESTMTYYKDGKIGWSDGFCYFNSTRRLSAPTISQVLKWLREEKTLHVYIEYVFSESSIWICEVQLIGSYERFYPHKDYETYEEAAIAGVNYCLENLI